MKLRAVAAIALLLVGMGFTVPPQGHATVDDCAVANPLAPQAEMFATSNTATIADSDDPRLHDRLEPFASAVYGTILSNGARPVGSDLMDGVFWSEDLQQLTFETSREFHLACVDESELTHIAELVAAQFGQESALGDEGEHGKSCNEAVIGSLTDIADIVAGTAGTRVRAS